MIDARTISPGVEVRFADGRTGRITVISFSRQGDYELLIRVPATDLQGQVVELKSREGTFAEIALAGGPP